MKEKMVRRLRQGLIISGMINILLATLLFYWWLKPIHFHVEIPTLSKAPLTAEEIETAGELLVKWGDLPYPALVDKLQSPLPVEWGYAERDFALALLIQRHHFDLSRALPGQVFSKRTLLFQKETLHLYPSLTDFHYAQIVNFATHEQWPVTAEGLYTELKREPDNLSLRQLFTTTPEYQAIERSFCPCDELVRVILKEEWSALLELVKQPLTPRERQKYLLEKMQQQDLFAARLLVKTDSSFVVKQLDDATILQLLTLLGKDESTQSLARELLKTPRSDLVLQRAREFVPVVASPVVVKTLPPKALAVKATPIATAPTVAPKKIAVGATPMPSQKGARGEILYVVQEGDTLWQIAKKYHAEVAEIRKRNAITSDALKPGKIIKIPG